MPTAVDRRLTAISQVAAPSMPGKQAAVPQTRGATGSGAVPRPNGGSAPATPRPGTATATPVYGGTGASPVASGYPAAPGMPGAADPTYLAYMRQLGVEESQLNALLAHRTDSLTRQLERGLPGYAIQRERAIENTGNSWEDRGMFRSGGRVKGQFDAAADVDRERMDWEAGIRDQITEGYLTTAIDIAALRRDLLEQGFSGAQATAIANAQAGV